MNRLRDDLRALHAGKQSRLGDLAGSSDRLIRNAMQGPEGGKSRRLQWFAALAALLLAAIVIASFALVKANRGNQPLPSGVPTPSATAKCAPATTYGLLIVAGAFEMISPRGCVAARATLTPASAQTCAPGLPAVLPPPLSASTDRVYFRDGDTKIRYLTPTGQTGAAATVPGGSNALSFFSVSPDDQRIAVMVEDFSLASTIGLRLYVEDLNGGAHHSEIYSASISKGGRGTTLWPAGWRHGDLVLESVVACSAAPVFHPSTWRVVDPSTGATKVNIDVSMCHSSVVPSAGGVACFGPQIQLQVFDWTGAQVYSTVGPFLDLDQPVGISPSGQDLFFNQGSATTNGQSRNQNRMWANSIGGGGSMGLIEGHTACLWLDDGTIMAADAVVAYPAGTVTLLPAKGQCVGRYPGGL